MAKIICTTIEEVNAISDPKIVWFDINRWVVFTEGDILEVNPPLTEDHVDCIFLRNNTAIQLFESKTPQQAADYIENNVTTLSQAKEILKLYAMALCVLFRRI